MNEFEKFVWVESERPRKISECILPKQIKKDFEGFVKAGSIPNLILHGTSGLGKTSVAKALCEELGYDILIINGGSEGRSLETVRNLLVNFASSASIDGTRKCVIIDEADNITDNVFKALNFIIEEFHSNCSFIFTANYPARILPAIRSRCSNIDFKIPSAERNSIIKQLYVRLTQILEKNNVEYDKLVIAELIKLYFPDFRRIINELQRYSANGKIDSGIFENSFSNDISELINILKNKDFGTMRKWVAQSPDIDMGILVRTMYDKVYEISEPDTIPNMILLLNEHQYKHAFVSDKEINIATMLLSIMMEVSFV